MKPTKKREILGTILLLIVALFALAAPAGAADITVSPGTGAIQAGVNSAANGDTIILSAGTYSENNITITGKSLTFRAADGHDRTDTIIDGTSASPRIFNVTDSSSLTIDNLTLQNGRAENGRAANGGPNVPAPAGTAGKNGGAISSAGPVIITSSTITGCKAGSGGPGGYGNGGGGGGSGGSGGAVYSTGSVTVTSSTISGCTAGSGGTGGPEGIDGPGGGDGGYGGSGGSGGAVYSTGTVTVMSSTISGCTAGSGGPGEVPDPGGPGGSGGAVYSTGTVTVTSSTISGSKAGSGGRGGMDGIDGSGGVGGAVYGAGTIHFSRLVNNGAGTVVYGSSSLDAADNWWGSDDNPSGHLGGGATAGTWLVLGATASPASVATTGTSAFRANLTYHTDGTTRSAASGAVPDGTPVTVTAAGGSVSPVHAATDSGIAATTFTPSSAGTATVTATVDQQSVSMPVKVHTGYGSATALGVDPVQPVTVYAGVDGNGVYRSGDAGSSWSHLTLPTGADLRIRALAPVRLAGSTATTIYAGSYGGGVYRSTDGGDHWSTCGVLPDQRVLSLVANSTAGVYAGTENGVYTSADNCAGWTAVNGGLP